MKFTPVIVCFFFIFFTCAYSCSTSYDLKVKTTLAIVGIESSSFLQTETNRISSDLRNELSKNSQIKIVSGHEFYLESIAVE